MTLAIDTSTMWKLSATVLVCYLFLGEGNSLPLNSQGVQMNDGKKVPNIQKTAARRYQSFAPRYNAQGMHDMARAEFLCFI